MAGLTEAFGPTEGHPWEKQENPQKYTYLASEYISPTPKRHILGLVGGNEVSVAEGNVVDVESDLRGINLPNTFAPWRKYQPPPVNQREIKRDNVKIKLSIDVAPMHLPVYQMWAYPGMPTPLPIKNEVCKNPEKY
jgi:hypothetical protein